MVASPDFVSFIKRSLALEPMEKIAHDRRMALPSFWCGLKLTISIQESVPACFARTLCNADELGSRAIDDQSKSIFQVDQFVQMVTTLVKCSMFESHTQCVLSSAGDIAYTRHHAQSEPRLHALLPQAKEAGLA
jgi:hypothetical protein